MGFIRKMSRFLASQFGLYKLERYAENVTFEVKDGSIYVKSKSDKRVLQTIIVPYGHDPLPLQLKAFLMVYWEYEIFRVDSSCPYEFRFRVEPFNKPDVTVDKAASLALTSIWTHGDSINMFVSSPAFN